MFVLSLPNEGHHHSDQESDRYAQSMSSGGCCVDGSFIFSCGRYSCLSHACPHISYFVHNSQLYVLWTAGGAVGGHCDVLARCSSHCPGSEGTAPWVDCDTLDACSIDAIGDISDKYPLRRCTGWWRGRTTGWYAVAHRTRDICHLDTKTEDEETRTKCGHFI